MFVQIEKPLQKHGGRLEHNETYCGSCYGAQAVSLLSFFVFLRNAFGARFLKFILGLPSIV